MGLMNFLLSRIKQYKNQDNQHNLENNELYKAINNHDYTKVKEFMDKGINPNSFLDEYDNRTYFILALDCFVKHEIVNDEIDSICEEYMNIIATMLKHGASRAVFVRYPEALIRMFKYGAKINLDYEILGDPDEINIDGLNLLGYAVREKNIDLIKILIEEANADTNLAFNMVLDEAEKAYESGDEESKYFMITALMLQNNASIETFKQYPDLTAYFYLRGWKHGLSTGERARFCL